MTTDVKEYIKQIKGSFQNYTDLERASFEQAYSELASLVDKGVFEDIETAWEFVKKVNRRTVNILCYGIDSDEILRLKVYEADENDDCQTAAVKSVFRGFGKPNEYEKETERYLRNKR